MTERESMEVDVVIVGGGPSGLAAAIRLKQLADEQGKELSIVVLEKASEIGAQVLICISPSTKLVKGVPGTWVGKNGYTACSRALYDSLYSKFDPNAPPTNSLPST